MKYIVLLALLIPFTSVKAQYHLTVQVDNVESNEGYMLFDVVDSTGTSVNQSRTKAQKGTTKIILDELPAGTYMIRVLQDLDNNLKMTTNFIGLPKEPYGFSKDVMGTFGPPSFDEASFNFASDSTIHINLKGL